jgi:hypothetical protein
MERWASGGHPSPLATARVSEACAHNQGTERALPGDTQGRCQSPTDLRQQRMPSLGEGGLHAQPTLLEALWALG